MATDAREQLRAELRQLINGRVPESVRDGSWNRVISYKDAISAAQRAMRAPNSTLMSLMEARSQLRRFTDPKP